MGELKHKYLRNWCVILSLIAAQILGSSPTFSAPAGDITPPTVMEITFVSTAGCGNTYRLGEQVFLDVRFSEVVIGHGNLGTRLAAEIGSNVRNFDYYGGDGTDTWRYAYTISEGDSDSDGISIASNSLYAYGPFPYIRDTASPANYATYTSVSDYEKRIIHSSVSSNSAHKVDGSVWLTPERITLAATKGTSRSITVSWCKAANAASYILNVYSSSGSLLQTITNVLGTSYVIDPSVFPTIQRGVAYKISVTPTESAGYAIAPESPLHLTPSTTVRGREDARRRR